MTRTIAVAIILIGLGTSAAYAAAPEAAGHAVAACCSFIAACCGAGGPCCP